MFCPECHSEYRPGFTKCSSCEVDLVDRLDDDAQTASHHDPVGPSAAEHEPFLALSDEQYFGAVVEVLDEARIPHREERKNTSMIPALGGSKFFVYVEPRYREAAKAALDRFQEQFAIPEENGEEGDEPPASDFVPDDFNPDDATAEVWHGEDLDLHDLLVTCLNNVGIGCATHLESAEGAAAAVSGARVNPIFVLPADEARAKEVIREIVDQSPPK